MQREIKIVLNEQLDRLCYKCKSPITTGQKYYALGIRGVCHMDHFSADDMPSVFPENIFGEENLLSSQASPKTPWVRQQYLFLAILENATTELFKYQFSHSRRGQRLEREALDWIQKEDEKWAGSFNNCCHAIGSDPDYVRRGILRKWEEVRSAALSQTMGMVANVHIPTTKRITHITRPSARTAKGER